MRTASWALSTAKFLSSAYRTWVTETNSCCTAMAAGRSKALIPSIDQLSLCGNLWETLSCWGKNSPIYWTHFCWSDQTSRVGARTFWGIPIRWKIWPASCGDAVSIPYANQAFRQANLCAPCEATELWHRQCHAPWCRHKSIWQRPQQSRLGNPSVRTGLLTNTPHQAGNTNGAKIIDTSWTVIWERGAFANLNLPKSFPNIGDLTESEAMDIVEFCNAAPRGIRKKWHVKGRPSVWCPVSAVMCCSAQMSAWENLPLHRISVRDLLNNLWPHHVHVNRSAMPNSIPENDYVADGFLHRAGYRVTFVDTYSRGNNLGLSPEPSKGCLVVSHLVFPSCKSVFTFIIDTGLQGTLHWNDVHGQWSLWIKMKATIIWGLGCKDLLANSHGAELPWAAPAGFANIFVCWWQNIQVRDDKKTAFAELSPWWLFLR